MTKYCGVMVIACLLASVAVAEEVAPNPVAAVESTEEIVVTAQKRPEKLQRVPLSVSALTAKGIEDKGLTDFKNLQEYVPNLRIQPATDTRSTAIYIRGIGQSGSNAGIDPTVTGFLDGVYLGRASITTQDLLDIERIEVLRGPQGTLYGKNTSAGAINIITKKPTFDYEGVLEGVAGNHNATEARGVVNAPLVKDQIATRLSAYRVLRSGFDRNDFLGDHRNNEDKVGFRDRTLFAVGDNLDVIIGGDFSKEHTHAFAPDILTYDGAPSLNVTFNPSAYPNTASLSGTLGRPLPAANGFDRHIDANAPSLNDTTNYGLAVEANYYLGDHTITWLNAYRQLRSFSVLDSDFSRFDVTTLSTRQKYNQTSSELRLASPQGGTLEYLVGAFIFYNGDETVQDLAIGKDFLDVAPSPVQGGSKTLGQLFRAQIPPPPDPNRIANVDTNNHRTRTGAVFGQATYKFAERWSLTGGLRLDYERKTRVGTHVSDCKTIAGMQNLICGPDQALDEARDSFHPSPMLSLRYFATDDAMTYVTAARAFKSGGFNQLRTLSERRTGGAVLGTEFDDESSTSVEVGSKTSWFDRKLTFNADFFHTWYDDLQVQTFDGTGITVVNAARLRSYGVESEVTARPHADVVLAGAFGWNIARYGSFPTAPCTAEAKGSFNTNCTQDLAGRIKDNAPEFTLSLFPQYEHSLSPFVRIPSAFYLRPEYSFRSDFFLDQDLDPVTHQGGISLLNLRTGVRAADNRWDVTFWVQNITDERYLVIATDVPIMNGFWGVNGPPRTFGTTVRVRL